MPPDCHIGTFATSGPGKRGREYGVHSLARKGGPAVRIGISIGTTFEVTDHRIGPRSVLEQALAAARAGLDTLSLGDHHSTGPTSYVQNVPMLGRILAEW